MAIVEDLMATNTIRAMVDEAFACGEIEEWFEPIPDGFEPGEDTSRNVSS